MSDRWYTTSDLATEFATSKATVHRKARELGVGINLGGSAGFRYSEDDRLRLIESMRVRRAA